MVLVLSKSGNETLFCEVIRDNMVLFDIPYYYSDCDMNDHLYLKGSTMNSD